MGTFHEISIRFAMLYSTIYASTYRGPLAQNPTRFEDLASYKKYEPMYLKYVKQNGGKLDIAADALGISEFYTNEFNESISKSGKVVFELQSKLTDYLLNFDFLKKFGFSEAEINSLGVDQLKQSFLDSTILLNNRTNNNLNFKSGFKPAGGIRDSINLVQALVYLVGGIFLAFSTMGIGAIILLYIWNRRKTKSIKESSYKAQLGLLKKYSDAVEVKNMQVLSLQGVKSSYANAESYLFGKIIHDVLMNIRGICEEKGVDKSLVIKSYLNRLVKIHDAYYKKYEKELSETESLLIGHRKKYKELVMRRSEEIERKAKQQEEWNKAKEEMREGFNYLRSSIVKAIEPK